MWLSTFLLTACVSISGCNHSALANNIEAIKEETNHILLQASEFDYSDYDFTFDQQEELTKQALYEYATNNDLLSELNEDNIENDSTIDSEAVRYTNDDNLLMDDSSQLISLVNEMNFLQGVEDFAINIDSISNLFETNLDSVATLSETDEMTPINFDGGHQLGNTNNGNTTQVITSGSSNDSSSGGGSTSDGDLGFANNNGTGRAPNSTNSQDEDDDYTLPEKSYDESNVTTYTNASLNDCFFLGIIATKDACINVYNVFAGWANNQLTYEASGSGSPLKLAIEALKVVGATVATTTIGASVTSLISSAIASVASYLGSIWSGYLAMFTTGGIVGIIIGIIVTIMALAVITVIASMIVFGWLGKGYAIGWKIYHLFHWEWYNGILD